jgi:hypothetical protein
LGGNLCGARYKMQWTQEGGKGGSRRDQYGYIIIFLIDKMSRIVYYYYFSKNVMQRYFCQSFTIQKPTIP